MDTITAKKLKLKKESEFQAAMKRFAHNKAAMFGLCLFVLFFIISFLSPVLAPYGYAEMNLSEIFQGPSAKHWLGTDDLGRDMLSRIMYGGRYSLSMGFIIVAISALIGVAIGAIVGYYGGIVDTLVMRFLDIFQAIPGMLLTIAISAALGAGFANTVLAMSIGRIPQFARLTRGTVMKVRTNEYVEAAEAIGCNEFRRIMRYILPNAWSPLIVSATMGIATSITGLAGLSYIGLGIQPPAPEWGAMLSGGKDYIRTYPYLIMIPGIFIATTVLSLNLAGDGLRDALDPRLKD